MLYYSKCMTFEEWEDQKESYLKEGDWEIYIDKLNLVYLRKHISGETNTGEGWSNVK